MENLVAITTFFYPCSSRESIVFRSNFENGELDDLHAMRSAESKNHIFSIVSICVFVYLLSA